MADPQNVLSHIADQMEKDAPNFSLVLRSLLRTQADDKVGPEEAKMVRAHLNLQPLVMLRSDMAVVISLVNVLSMVGRILDLELQERERLTNRRRR